LRVGVTGARGLLGTTLVPLWRGAGADVVAWDVEDFDVRDAGSVRRVIGSAQPDVVLHAAAYTAVDRAEAEPDLAMAVNRDGTANVCRACADAGARVVYVSTDYVFDGRATAPIPPDARRTPLGVYARGKAEGEAAVERSAVPWTIVRTAWVFGPGGGNFVDTMRKAAAEGRALKVVNDQTGAPTSTRLLAEGLWALVRREAAGHWHLTASGAASWFEVARAVYAAAGADPALVAPCTTAEAARAAPRPAYSVLDCGATRTALGVSLPPWEKHVMAYVRTGRVPGLGLIQGEGEAA
jgi:dTDP-4-dehydrorhamnose reductase